MFMKIHLESITKLLKKIKLFWKAIEEKDRDSFCIKHDFWISQSTWSIYYPTARHRYSMAIVFLY